MVAVVFSKLESSQIPAADPMSLLREQGNIKLITKSQPYNQVTLFPYPIKTSRTNQNPARNYARI